MTSQTQQSNLQQMLSEEVLVYLKSYETYQKFQEIAVAFGVTDESKLNLITAIFLRALSNRDSIEDLPKNLESFLEISQDQTNALLKKIGESILVAIVPQVPGLEQVLKSWGVVINESAFLQEHKEEAETIDQFVQAFVEASEEYIEPRIQHRLERLLVDYASGHSTKEQTLAFLTKQEKTGGLEMDQASAEAILADFDLELGEVEIVTQSKVETIQPVPSVTEPLISVAPESTLQLASIVLTPSVPASPAQPISPAPLPVVPVQPKPVESVSAPKIVAFTKEDEAEIARTLEAKQHVVSAPKPLLSEEVVVTDICKKKDFQFEDPLLQERCVSIVNARVREVRDAFKTRIQLEKPVEAGGLGVSGRKLADMMQVLEDTFVEYQQSARRQIDAQKKQKPVENKLEKEQAKLDEKYGELTKTVRKAVNQIEQIPPGVGMTQGAGGVGGTGEKTGNGMVKRTPIIRPNMKDVQFERRLVGPIEELSTMTLVEFRRLSEIPERACEKVLSKIDLLEQQGYDKKVQGVSAWKNAPIYKQYMMIAQETLMGGGKIQEVISKHKAVGEEMMTLQEYMAILNLNAKMRF